MTPEEERYTFEDTFLAELDSAYSADIACCERCFDEFVAMWPHAYSANGAELQCAGIEVSWFYEYSRLPQLYTQEQFNEFIRELDCPRCGESLGGVIYLTGQCSPDGEPGLLAAQLECLAPLHGNETIARWQRFARDGAWDAFVEDLLARHYDPAYRRSTLKHYPALARAKRFELRGTSEDEFTRVAEALRSSCTAREFRST